MPTPRARAEKFALFINHALKEARASGMTVADIEKATGVSKSTIYRWAAGDSVVEPRVNQVWDFCLGLGIPPDAAGRLLGWTREPIHDELEAPLRRIQAVLSDTNVDERRKRSIRDTLRGFADVAEQMREKEAVA